MLEFLMIVSPILLVGLALFSTLTGDAFRALAWFRRPFVPKVKPRVAYKRACVSEDGFSGVGVDVRYGVTSKAIGLGFHAYEKLDDALTHAQQGDVFLEVLLSGTVREHNKGYIASHQRVLQVISDHCAYCRASGTHFAKSAVGLEFFCGFHAVAAKPGFLGGLTRVVLDPVLKQKGIKPLDEFAASYSWLKGADVVVTSQSSRTGFVPTLIPEETS